MGKTKAKAETEQDRVVLYARISKDRDNETSTESQLRLMRQFCEVKGWTVVGEYVDYGKSAYKLEVKRPQLEAAFAMIERGFADRLLIWKLDRLTRNAKGFVAILDRLQNANGALASVHDSWLDTGEGTLASLLRSIMVHIAQMEAENAQVRIKPWHDSRKREGGTPGGPRPYGYSRSRNALTINEDEAIIVKRICADVIAGDSLRSIARRLNAEGIPTATGADWNVRSVKYIATNPTIAALRKSEGELIASKVWLPIIDRKTFDACCAILNDPSRRTNTGNEARHLLAGLLTCGRCGSRVLRSAGQWVEGKRIAFRYQCRECSNSIDGDALEAFVSDQLLALIDDNAWNDLRSRGRKADPFAMERMRKFLSIERAKRMAGEISEEEWADTQREAHEAIAKLEQAEAVELPDVDSLRADWSDMRVEDKQLVIAAVFRAITIQPYVSGTTGTKRIDIDIAD